MSTTTRKLSGIEKEIVLEVDVMAALLKELPDLRYWTALTAYGSAYDSDPADIVAYGDGAGARQALKTAEASLARALREIRKAHGVLFRYGGMKP